ncbi:MAG: GNAT family N-acetyltransferase [Nitrospirae bacterium]|nr:GNAT family N-acetyltransferase [Nitrospirota bacterium]
MNSSHDIVISCKDAALHFRYLAWDTEFFGRRSYILDTAKSIIRPVALIKEQIKHKLGDSFVTVRINTEFGIETVSFLEDCGFYYVDTEVRLRYVKPRHGELLYDSGSVSIERPQLTDDLPCELLGSAFTQTRFHTDFHIDDQKADQLWISYLKNYRPSPNGHLFTAKADNDVAGVIVVNTSNSDATLFFVSVIEKFRNRAIGSILINSVIDCFNGYNLYTGTQIKNTAALNFYIKNGFSAVDSTKTVLHYWG